MFARLAPLVFLVISVSAYSQTAIPRTADGHPDFSGAWASSFITPLERPAGVTALVVGEAEAKEIGERLFQQLMGRGAGVDPDVLAADIRTLAHVGAGYRTSLVIDPATGRIPYTPEGQRIIDAARARIPQSPDGPEFRPISERCIASHGRTPMTLTPTGNTRQIVETGQNLMLYTEEGGDTRIVPFGGAHRPEAVVMWGGDSVAHWEGDTLVIDTVNSRGSVQGGAQGVFVVSPETRIAERLTFLGPDEILYAFSVADPRIYATPWRVEYVFVRSRTPAGEFSCHEGNYSMLNMLRSARAMDARAKPQSAGEKQNRRLPEGSRRVE